MSTSDWSAIRTLAEQATPGPWRADVEQPGDRVVWGPGADKFVANIGLPVAPMFPSEVSIAFDAEAANCEFIAAARTAIPELLEALDTAEQERAEAKAEVERLTRRLWPAQGESYANEVERQRVIIDTFETATARLRASLASAEATIEAVRRHVDEHLTHPSPAVLPAEPETDKQPKCQEPTCPDFGDPDFGEATCLSSHAGTTACKHCSRTVANGGCCQLDGDF